MSEFYKIAESILQSIEQRREIFPRDDMSGINRNSVTIDEIRDAVTHCTRESINFYPGTPGAPCHDLAVFVSLSSPLYIKGRKHLKCNETMEKIVQHMQGNCFERTKKAVFITDSWDEVAFSKWKANLEQISKSNYFEIYLITGQNISEIKI